VTRIISYPLRQPGTPWPGTNTRGGRLDQGGQLTLTGSKNVQINVVDTLSKRPGFVRGLDERFTGAVCGIHRYTDECGIEWLLVVDEEGFHVRQPFDVPVFEVSDAFPIDGFSNDADRLNLDRWIDPALAYVVAEGSMRLRPGLVNADRRARWFKETPSAIRTELLFTFEDESVSTTTLEMVQLNGATDLQGAGIKSTLQRAAGVNNLSVILTDATGAQASVLAQGSFTALSGILRVGFNSSTRIVDVLLDTNLDTISETATITEAAAADLGGWFGLGILSDTASLESGFPSVFTENV
jgi:hypothetical protein